jgi:hypothetical protein
MKIMSEKRAIGPIISIIIALLFLFSIGITVILEWLDDDDPVNDVPKDLKDRVSQIESILSSLDKQLTQDLAQEEYIVEGFITNSNFNKWSAESANIQTAIDDLGETGGAVWLPEKNFDIYEDIIIKDSRTRVYGAGEGTKFTLHDDSRILSEDNDNIVLENFSVTGSGKIWIELGYNTFLNNIKAENVSPIWNRAFTFFCFKLPNGQDRGGLFVNNCHVNYCTMSGFMIYGEVAGSIIHNVEFNDCSAEYCGWDVNGVSQQSPWSVGFVFTEQRRHFSFHLQNLTVRNCQANNNWESGFHFEWVPTQLNCKFYNCVANNNGHKLNYADELPDEFYCSGFLNIKDGVHCYNCIANENTAYGFTQEGGTLTECSATGNGIADIL